MLLATSTLWLSVAYASNILQSQSKQLDQSIIARARCGAVNFLVTAFLPQAHATAFCSAYLQIPVQFVTSTTTVQASALTVTETSNKIVPTMTKTVSTVTTSTSTRTVDLWTGTPACSTVPDFAWLRDKQSRREAKSIAVIEQACSCLSIPATTSTVHEVATTIPTLTVNKGLKGLIEITSTMTQVATETRTKYIFLIDRPKPTPLSEFEGENESSVMTESELERERCSSSLSSSNETAQCHDSASRLAIIGLGSESRVSPVF